MLHRRTPGRANAITHLHTDASNAQASELDCITAALHAGGVHLEGSYDWWDHAVGFEVVPGAEPLFVGRAYLPSKLRFHRFAATESAHRESSE